MPKAKSRTAEIQPSAAADVVVVGGGPAGACAALALRRCGVSVVVLDRATFPRDKVCGDVLLPEARETLRSLGLDLAGLQRSAYLCTGVRYVGMSGPQVAGEFRDVRGSARPWWMVRRREFDAWLLSAAREAGAEVIEGFSVDGLCRDERGVFGVTGRSAEGVKSSIRTKVVVGADGASSVVAREVGEFRRLAAHTCIAARAYVADIELPAPFLEVFTTSRALPGCAWIAPVGTGEANVGIGIVLNTANRINRTPQALFDEIRDESPLLADRLRNAGTISLRGWTLPAATEQRAMAGAGWLLVGDAAGLIDPFTGHGIQNALTSGVLAAEVIADALGKEAIAPRALLPYEARCRSTLRSEVDRGAFLQRLHSSPVIMRAVVESCARHAGLRDRFVGLVGHAAPRRDLLSFRHLLQTRRAEMAA